MSYIVSGLIGYLLGSISFSYLIAKTIAKIDIRQHGSGNAGATNTLRVLGKGPAALVLILDALKGIAAMLLSAAWFGFDPAVMVTAGVTAVIGHNWPLFTGFRGGKGIATTIGVMFVLSWPSTLIAGLIGVALIAWTRYVSLGSIVYMLLIPLGMYFFKEPVPYLIGSVITALLAVYRHQGNLSRLLRGNERKIGETTSNSQ